MSWQATNTTSSVQCDVGDESDLGCATGFSGRERDPLGSFRWTDGHATVRLTGAGYAGPCIGTFTIAAPRPAESPPAQVALNIEGRHVPLVVEARPRTYQLLLKPRPLSGDATTVMILSDTFDTPGGRRTLGAQVYSMSLQTLGASVFPSPWLWWSLFGVGLTALVGFRAELRTIVGVVSAVGIMALLAWLWAWLPARVVPFLPALAMVGGGLALYLQRFGDLTLLRHPILIMAVLLNALFDGLIVAQMVPRSLIIAALGGQLALTLLAVHSLKHYSTPTLSQLLVLTGLVRLLAYAARLLAAQAASDPDTLLFYTYGRATLDLGTPLVEYPSGALLPWALLALPESSELFTLLFPLFNLLCELAIVWGLYTIAAQLRNPSGWLFALFYAVSPLLLPFWQGKYDPLPAALLVTGLACLTTKRVVWVGVLLGLGGAVKWVPWLALPFVAWYVLRRESDLKLALLQTIRLFVGFGAAVTAVSLPFALIDLDTFLAPYRLQTNRPIIGESIWFLPAVWLDPSLIDNLPAPWSGVRNPPFGRELTVGVQLAMLLALGIWQLFSRPNLYRTVTLALLAPLVFLLLNRVFSPQYVLIISVCVLSAAASLSLRRPMLLLGLLGVVQVSNLLIWPNTMPYWLIASLILFSCGLALVVWLLSAAQRYEDSE
jgi:hypothetical protein